MQTLYRESSYPKEIRQQLQTMPPLATEILNRWMMGWPKRVKALMEAQQLIPELIAQEESERTAYSAPGNRHLARHEIAQMYGLTDAPPTL